MSAPQINVEEWEAAIKEAEADGLDKVPAGWVTLRQFAAAKKLSVAQASKIMRDLVSSKRSEVRKFSILTTRGSYRVPHYRLLKGKK